MNESPVAESPLRKAVRVAGGQSAFGRLIGKRQSTVFEWLKLGKPLPAEYVRLVEQKLGVSRFELRPDLYPPEEGHLHVPPAGRTVGGRGPVASCDRPSILQIGEPAR